MPRKKKEPSVERDIDALMEALNKNSRKSRITRASDVSRGWRYIDFWDLGAQTPCLPLEYLYGTRGFISGRIVKYEGEPHCGKSIAVYMNYAMAMCQTGGVYAVHCETEGTALPPDFIYKLGCNPKDIIVIEPGSVDQCLDDIIDLVKAIRRSDPDRKFFILVAIDSVSSLGTVTANPKGYGKVEGKKKELEDESSGKGVAYHSRKFSEWLRDWGSFLSWNDVLLMFTAQQKEKVADGGGFGSFTSPGADTKTTLADNPTEYHASWTVEVSNRKWWDNVEKRDVGEIITMKCKKNKLSPKARRINVYFRRDGDDVGFDFFEENKKLFGQAFRDITPGEYTNSGGWYKHKQINKGKAMQDAKKFFRLCYENEELLMKVREYYHIRGFGFKFEASYSNDIDTYSKEEADKLNTKTKEPLTTDA